MPVAVEGDEPRPLACQAGVGHSHASCRPSPRGGAQAGGLLERPRVRGRRLPDPRVLVASSGVPLHGEVTNTRSTVPYLESGGLEPHAWGAPYLDYQALS